MEEKKNNAIEKVENIINGSKTKSPTEESVKRAEQISHRQKLAKDKIEKRIERARSRAEKKAQKDQMKSAKMRYRARKRAERKAEKMDKKVSKSKSPNNSWKILAVSLAVSTLILASVLMVSFIVPSATDTGMENAYRKAFYDIIEQVDNIDVNLSKAVHTKDTGAMQTYLVDVAINSELCENDIGELPLKDESKFYTAKLVNQIGDYCKYLNKKIINGESLSDNDVKMLKDLYTANKSFKASLTDMVREMDGDFSFVQMADGGVGNVVVKNFNELQNLSSSYPELIYDGPFSDGTAGREIKGLTGDKISKDKAEKIFEKIFSSRGIDNVSCTGKSDAITPTYNLTGDIDGDTLYAEITETGGKLLMFSFAGDCNKVNIDEDQAVEKATEFLTSIGIKDMTAVWVNLANNVYTINMATDLDGVVVYSDLIKVRVCGESGTVIGIEATTYYTNHKARTIETPTISKETARAKADDSMEIETSRLCIVPIGRTSEKLCYEFSGQMDGDIYYVYIDAKTGKQVEMFRVIDSQDGKLLI